MSIKLGYFTMPVHPPERSPTETLKEDREIIILADQLSFHDAFVGEHLSDKIESITNSMLFLATLIHSTKTIKQRHHQSVAHAPSAGGVARSDVRSSL